MTDNLFTDFERLETCQRTEVTLANLHLLAQHFGATAVYAPNESGPHAARMGPHLVLPLRGYEGEQPRVVEVGAWIDARGSRWNPEPLTQGWSPAGTYTVSEPGGSR